ncbi:MAG: family 20 glycosylhydrolase [Chitinophagaceae bacterium]|nr:family 20 glycosylhydrolase [Chitinophagaceae bacterium]
MKKLSLSLIILFLGMGAFAQVDRVDGLIPRPASVKKENGTYTLPASFTLSYGERPELKDMAERLAAQLRGVTGATIRVATPANASEIVLTLSNAAGTTAEGYRLNVNASGVAITASNPAGIFYGIQTLLQLLPPDVNGNTAQNIPWDIPYVEIEDHPRFGWRGLMLDVSRHFFTKEEVKRYIDDMVKYKFNVLHWHLTDDQGWRIEIKSYPKLTSVGAWRVNKTGTFGNFSKPEPNEPRDYGGFYTQDDIREIVQYAKERHVNILPEIDVPGHSLAAIAAYPELTCTPGKYEPSSGDRFMVWPGGGQHFYGLIDNSLCPAKEEVYVFLDKVFGEIAELFPFEYIHMGGDETARNFWDKSPLIKALMQKEKLKNLDEVQSYFVKRVEKIINAKGKKMIGWDEILQGGLAPNATVMSWRGMKHGIEAAKMGHEVIMTPTDFVYIDYMQSDRIMEPPVYASLRLKKVYQFDPVPNGVDNKLIKGGQANLWTEQIYTFRQVQYMTWPRAFAVAEVLWSPNKTRNWKEFVQRVESQFLRLDAAKTKYAPSMYDPEFKVTKKGTNQVEVTLINEVDGLDIHYSFDNSYPDEFYPKYTAPLLVPKDAFQLKVITYRDGKPIGRMIAMPVEELKKRAGVK